MRPPDSGAIHAATCGLRPVLYHPDRQPIPPTTAPSRRRGHGKDAIYWDASRNRYTGAVNLGFGPDGKRIRRKVIGKTKVEVRDKLKLLHQQLQIGLKPHVAALAEAPRSAGSPEGSPSPG